jgi:hypothetical protein
MRLNPKFSRGTMDTSSPGIFEATTPVPWTLLGVTAILFFSTVGWILISVRQLANRQFKLNTTYGFQTIGWVMFALDQLTLMISLSTYMSCRYPTIQLVPSWSESKCAVSVLLHACKMLRVIGCSFLLASVLKRFHPTYKSFAPINVSRAHFMAYLFLLVHACLCCIFIGIGMVNRVSTVVDPSVQITIWELIEAKLTGYIAAIITALINFVSAWQGIRFVMKQLKKVRKDILDHSMHQTSLLPKSQYHLRLTYIFLFLNFVTALLYFLFNSIYVFPQFRSVPYLVRYTVGVVIINMYFVCMMLAMTSLSQAVADQSKLISSGNSGTKSCNNNSNSPNSA